MAVKWGIIVKIVLMKYDMCFFIIMKIEVGRYYAGLYWANKRNLAFISLRNEWARVKSGEAKIKRRTQGLLQEFLIANINCRNVRR